MDKLYRLFEKDKIIYWLFVICMKYAKRMIWIFYNLKNDNKSEKGKKYYCKNKTIYMFLNKNVINL